MNFPVLLFASPLPGNGVKNLLLLPNCKQSHVVIILEVQVSYPQGAGRQISTHKEIIKRSTIKVTNKMEK